MDFAITPSSVDGGSDGWDVVYLLAVRGAECPLHLAGFGLVLNVHISRDLQLGRRPDSGR